MSFIPAAENTLSAIGVNSRAPATLAAGATWQGVAEIVSQYGRAGIAIHADNATDGVLTIDTSFDGITYSGPSRAVSDTRFAAPHMWNIVEKYIRIKYVNGTTEATNFTVQTQYSVNSSILLAHQLDEVLADETEALAVRSVTVGQDSAGAYKNTGVVSKRGKVSQYSVAGFSDTFSVHLDHTVTPNSIDFAYMLVDLSDTTTWPHTLTGEVAIEYIIIEIDPATNFAGDFKIGYLKNVDGTNGDFVTVIDVDMASKSDIFQETIDFGSHALHCNDDSHFGPVDLNNTLFRTSGANLGGPDDPSTLTYPSGDGDLVLVVTGNNNAVGISITIGYETAT